MHIMFGKVYAGSWRSLVCKIDEMEWIMCATPSQEASQQAITEADWRAVSVSGRNCAGPWSA